MATRAPDTFMICKCGQEKSILSDVYCDDCIKVIRDSKKGKP